jgi:hypothetical protein
MGFIKLPRMRDLDRCRMVSGPRTSVRSYFAWCGAVAGSQWQSDLAGTRGGRLALVDVMDCNGGQSGSDADADAGAARSFLSLFCWTSPSK